VKLSYVISTQPTRFAAVSLAENFEATVARLAELGYDGVELAVRDPGSLDAPAVRKILEANHLHCPALGTGQAYVEEGLSFTDPDATVRARAIERIEAHIALAKELAYSVIASEAKQSLNSGAEIASSQKSLLAMTQNLPPLVIIGLIRGKTVGAIPSTALHSAQDASPLRDALRRVSRVARDANVRLAIEPINRYETNLLNTVAETFELIDEIKSDNMGVLFDTFHANIEEPRIEDSLRACGSRLFHVHFADSNRWAPGFGHTDFTQIISTLREMKYNGWVSAEILQMPTADQAMQTAIETMRHFNLKS